MTQKNKIFIVNVMIIDLMWETMISNVISQTRVIVKLSAIIKIRKYRRFHERHHFILIAMKVHGAP
jgi:hypothetical protein